MGPGLLVPGSVLFMGLGKRPAEKHKLQRFLSRAAGPLGLRYTHLIVSNDTDNDKN